jgi:hypothetical protein
LDGRDGHGDDHERGDEQATNVHALPAASAGRSARPA